MNSQQQTHVLGEAHLGVYGQVACQKLGCGEFDNDLLLSKSWALLHPHAEHNKENLSMLSCHVAAHVHQYKDGGHVLVALAQRLINVEKNECFALALQMLQEWVQNYFTSSIHIIKCEKISAQVLIDLCCTLLMPKQQVIQWHTTSQLLHICAQIVQSFVQYSGNVKTVERVDAMQSVLGTRVYEGTVLQLHGVYEIPEMRNSMANVVLYECALEPSNFIALNNSVKGMCMPRG